MHLPMILKYKSAEQIHKTNYSTGGITFPQHSWPTKTNTSEKCDTITACLAVKQPLCTYQGSMLQTFMTVLYIAASVGKKIQHNIALKH